MFTTSVCNNQNWGGSFISTFSQIFDTIFIFQIFWGSLHEVGLHGAKTWEDFYPLWHGASNWKVERFVFNLKVDRWWIWRCLESSARCCNSKYDFITPPHLILHIFVNSSSSSSLLSSYSSSSPSPPPHQSAAFDRQPSHTCLKQQLST